jgi:signal transduction histidine kinase/tetratricopeptide (TPR) repeat protein
VALVCVISLPPHIAIAQTSQQLLGAIEQHRKAGQKDSEYVHLLLAAVEDLDLTAQAATFFDEARALLPHVRTPLLDADFLYAAGTVARIQNRLSAAADTLHLALDRYSALGQKAKVALLYSRLGLLYQQQGISEAAIEYHITALSLAEDIAYTDLIFRQNINLASTYNHLNQPEKALKLLNNAENIIPGDVAIQRKVSLFLFKADSYSRLGRIDSAKTNLIHALELTYRTSFRDTTILVYLYSSYAVIAQKAGDNALAQSMLDTTLALEQTMRPADYYNIRPLVDAARVMFFRAEQTSSSAEKSALYHHAIEFAERASSIPSSSKFYPLWLKEIMAKSYFALDHYKAAYSIQQEYISVRDSLFNIGLEKHIEAVQERLSRTKREREIERLTNESYANSRLQYALMLGVLVFLALIFALWNRYRLKKHSEYLVEHINIELQGTNEQLVQANFLLNNANNELSLAKEQAEEVNRMKRAFLDTISHEIRTPLTAIQGYSQLLGMMLSDTEQREFAERIHTAGEHLLLLFEDMLHLSKMHGDQVQIDLQPTSLNDLCRQVCAMFEEPARIKGVAIATSVSSALVNHFLLDASKVRLILFNLIGNAVKFTDNGFVRLTVEPIVADEARETHDNTEVRGIRIIIQDSGIGIEQEALVSIFDSFRQTNLEVDRKYGGLGLGLTICKNFVDILGGNIHAESEHGKGSTFTVELPLPGESS